MGSMDRSSSLREQPWRREMLHWLPFGSSRRTSPIHRAFEQTLAVRTLNPQAKELADRFFFETVVRVHRAGEGAPFTGLKPAGRDPGPAIPAADNALEERSLELLVTLLTDPMRDRLRQHFNEAVTARTYDVGDVAAGREYVRAYVEFIHFVERIYETSSTAAHGHFDETSEIQREHR
jgi:hypothetical protein